MIDAELTAQDKNALIRELDCYVSLHRSEGFGLTIAEAMLLGTPVIATDYGGSRDFVTSFNALPVDARPVAIGAGHDPYPAEGVWAEPDLDHAAHCMRAIRDDPRGRASARAARARRRPRRATRRRSPVARWRSGWRGSRSCRSTPTAAPRRSISAPCARGWRPARRQRPGHDGGARGAVRDAALRAMRPYTVHQRLVDEEILRVLQTLDERICGLAAGQQALAAELARQRREEGS